MVRILTERALATTLVGGGRKRVTSHFDVRAMGLAVRDVSRQVPCEARLKP